MPSPDPSPPPHPPPSSSFSASSSASFSPPTTTTTTTATSEHHATQPPAASPTSPTTTSTSSSSPSPSSLPPPPRPSSRSHPSLVSSPTSELSIVIPVPNNTATTRPLPSPTPLLSPISTSPHRLLPLPLPSGTTTAPAPQLPFNLYTMSVPSTAATATSTTTTNDADSLTRRRSSRVAANANLPSPRAASIQQQQQQQQQQTGMLAHTRSHPFALTVPLRPGLGSTASIDGLLAPPTGSSASIGNVLGATVQPPQPSPSGSHAHLFAASAASAAAGPPTSAPALAGTAVAADSNSRTSSSSIKTPSQPSPTTASPPPPPPAPPPPPPPVQSHTHTHAQAHLTHAVLDAVVRVTAVICQPNYDLPWQMRQEFTSVSTAFAVSGRRLLTVAHGVLYHTVIRVTKRSSDVFFHARVLCASEICDLALLAVDDERFWDDVPALPLGGLPRLQDAVVTVGYPATGVNICITSGVTSRIEMRNGYLTVQIDAAINPGNSGGPALGVAPLIEDEEDESGGEMNGELNGGDATSAAVGGGATDSGGAGKVVVVGVAFQKNDGNENTGFLIATDVVRHFLADYARNGRHTGSCLCGFIWQTLPDRDFRRYLRMSETDSGVLVVDVLRTSPAYGVLQKDDVVLAVDNVSISNAGKIAHASSGERLSFHALVVEKFPGDTIQVDILRDGERLRKEYCVRDSAHGEIIPQYVDDKKMPEYCIVGGLVLVAMTEDYVADGYGSNGRNRPGNLVNIAMMEDGLVEQGVKQVVLVSKVLNDEINVEYAHIVDQRVKECDGVRVKSLRHVKEIVEGSDREFVRFDLDYEVVVVDREKAKRANERLRRIHHIPAMSRLYAEDGEEEREGEKDDEGDDDDVDKGEEEGDGEKEEEEGDEEEVKEKEGDETGDQIILNDTKATTKSTTVGENGLGDGGSSDDDEDDGGDDDVGHADETQS